MLHARAARLVSHDATCRFATPPVLWRVFVRRQDAVASATRQAQLTRAALRWALEALVVERMTVVRVVYALDVDWHINNDTHVVEETGFLLKSSIRFDRVILRGVDGHV